MNTETLLLILGFLVYSGVREYLFSKQLGKLQELTKAKDLFEYYRGNKSNTVNDTNKGKDGIAKEEPNTIEMSDTEHFKLPDDMKVQWNDESTQNIKIYQ